MAATVKSSVKVFGGLLQRLTHRSSACACDMTFAVYMPPQAAAAPVPVVYWLSGLTCTDENFHQKSGFARAASQLGLCVVMPDTSPRGVQIDGADDSCDHATPPAAPPPPARSHCRPRAARYDFGSGAGFYVDATQPKWRDHYQMYSYVKAELPEVVAAAYPGKLSPAASICGHSMGGHGAACRGSPARRSGAFDAPHAAPRQAHSPSFSRTRACTAQFPPLRPSATQPRCRGGTRPSRATWGRWRRARRTMRPSL